MESKIEHLALFFAIEEYEPWSPLKYTIKEVSEIAENLKNSYGFDTENIENPNLQRLYSILKDYQEKTYEKECISIGFLFWSWRVY